MRAALKWRASIFPVFPGGSECSLSHLLTSRWCKVLKVHLLSRQSFHLWAQREQRDNTNTLFTSQAKQALTMGIVCRYPQSVLSWNFLKTVVPHFRHFFSCFQLSAAVTLFISVYPVRLLLAGWLADCCNVSWSYFQFTRVHEWRKRRKMYHEETSTLQKPRYGSKWRVFSKL